MLRSVTGIDHVLVGVRDLEAARGAWQRLGFTTTPRGSHIGWGTANYCIMFPDDYVELLGIVDPSQFTNDLDRFLAEREGLMGLAFASRDAAATAAELDRAGAAADGPKDLKRRLELPEGTVLPSFALVFADPAATPSVRAFFCQHLTPDLMRQPAWLNHPNGACALIAMTVLVEDLAGHADAYRRLFGEASVAESEGAVRVRAGGHDLVFAAVDGPLADHWRAAVEARPLPLPVRMTVRARERAVTRAFLTENEIAWRADEDGTVVPAEEATGVELEFRA